MVEADKNNPNKTQKQVTDSSASHHDEIREFINQLSPDAGTHALNIVALYIHQKLGVKGVSIYDDWRKNASDYPDPEEVQEEYSAYAEMEYIVDKSHIQKLIEENSSGTAPQISEQTANAENSKPEIIENDLPCNKKKHTTKPTIFDKHSLTGKSHILEKQQLTKGYVIDQIALKGQSTIFFAPSNTGKTLLTLFGVFESIQHGRINAADMYYIDHDDSHEALLEKLHLFEELGCHILADGYENLKARDFLKQADEICRRDQAREKIFVLDTLKKFVDPMSKRQCTEWGRGTRLLTAKGASVISLAHTNKNFDAEGWPIRAGVNDLVDDADAAYLMRIASKDEETAVATVELKNIKRRGDIVDHIAFCFSYDPKISYEERLASVERVDEPRLDKIKMADSLKEDDELITITTKCIDEGITTKMRLRDEISNRTGISKRKAVQHIDKYTGTDPDKHKWSFTTQEHGRKVYSLLTGDSDAE